MGVHTHAYAEMEKEKADTRKFQLLFVLKPLPMGHIAQYTSMACSFTKRSHEALLLDQV